MLMHNGVDFMLEQVTQNWYLSRRVSFNLNTEYFFDRGIPSISCALRKITDVVN